MTVKRWLVLVPFIGLVVGLGFLPFLAATRGWFSIDRSFILLFPTLVVYDYLFSPPDWRPQRIWYLFTCPVVRLPKTQVGWWRDVTLVMPRWSDLPLAHRNILGVMLALSLVGLLVVAVVTMPAPLTREVANWTLAFVTATVAIRWFRWWREVA